MQQPPTSSPKNARGAAGFAGASRLQDDANLAALWLEAMVSSLWANACNACRPNEYFS
jgi:hypothetical protein